MTMKWTDGKSLNGFESSEAKAPRGKYQVWRSYNVDYRGETIVTDIETLEEAKDTAEAMAAEAEKKPSVPPAP